MIKTHASLFSGIGAAEIAADWMGWQSLFHCEIQEFPRSCDLLKNSYLCLLNNTKLRFGLFGMLL